MQRAGHADLPLHYGRVPPWLATRMSRLGRAIVEAIVLEYGKSAFLARLSDPLWFQSFGAVLGMDWHSSGITTSVMGALKRALNPISKDLGIHVCGGRGKHSRRTPTELYQIADKTGLDGQHLIRCSRLSAKIDSTAVQDGFQVYLHSFVVTDEGEWAVVQQGMNEHNGFARRYHWHSSQLETFLKEPHTYVTGNYQGPILNLVAKGATNTQQGILELSSIPPAKLLPEIRQIRMPQHHDVKAKDLNLKRLGSIIALSQEEEVQDFEGMLLLKGLGPRTLQSLTLVSEVIYGTPSRFEDPARFSFAHGGKDGHPFPVPTKIYDKTVSTLRHAVEKAKIGHIDKKEALKSLHQTAMKIEKNFIPNDNYDKLIEKEWAESHLFGGRTVFDGKDQGWPSPKRKLVKKQLSLF